MSKRHFYIKNTITILVKGCIIEFPITELSTVTIICEDDKIKLSFLKPIEGNIILVNGRTLDCHPDDNLQYTCDIEQCPTSSESSRICRSCDYPKDDQGICPLCGDEKALQLRERGLGPYRPSSRNQPTHGECSGPSESMKTCERCGFFHNDPACCRF
jgi:hypothetical protein